MSPFAGVLARAALELFWPGRCPLCLDWLNQADPGVTRGSGFQRPALLHRSCLEILEMDGSRSLFFFPAAGKAVPVHFLWRDTAAFFRLLHSVKYGARHPLAEPLADALGQWVQSRLPLDSGARVVPVPDDPKRLRERGFSLNLILAAGVARACGLPFHPGVLRRRRSVRALATLEGSQARRSALQGVFAAGRIAELPPGVPLLLVDDQVTSGATLEACLPLLRARGHPVLALALAGAALAPREVHP